MDNLRRLEEIFTHFPGIGPRQAKRFVYYLLNKPASSVRELADLMNEVKKETSQCASCNRFFTGKNTGKNLNVRENIEATTSSLCSICTDTSRDQTSLMIVARDTDFESIEKSGAYHGLYFILGGTVPILDKEPEKRIRLKRLLERVPHFKETILSLNATPDGENTAEVVKQSILRIHPQTKITVLGRGLSTGSELEYADSETIKSALSNRK